MIMMSIPGATAPASKSATRALPKTRRTASVAGVIIGLFIAAVAARCFIPPP